MVFTGDNKAPSLENAKRLNIVPKNPESKMKLSVFNGMENS